jgi:hypothetical protein
VLFVSGTLNTKMGGPSITLSPMADRRHDLCARQPGQARRLPAAVRLSKPEPDAEKRFSTNVPLQRLFFMNSDFMQQHAERLAQRVIELPNRRSAHSEGVSIDFRPRGDAAEVAAASRSLRRSR